jgi:hypothetical protein
MIRKSVKRFSEKIMPKQEAKARSYRALAHAERARQGLSVAEPQVMHAH